MCMHLGYGSGVDLELGGNSIEVRGSRSLVLGLRHSARVSFLAKTQWQLALALSVFA